MSDILKKMGLSSKGKNTLPIQPGKKIDLFALRYALTGKLSLPHGPQIAGRDYIPPCNAWLKTPRLPRNPIVKLASVTLPQNFSWHIQSQVNRYHPAFMNKKVIMPVQNQEQCGSCWAWSTSTALSDRFSIANGGNNPQLGPSALLAWSVSGDKNNKVKVDGQNTSIGDGCNGGIPGAALYALGTYTYAVPQTCWNAAAWCSGDDVASGIWGQNKGKCVNSQGNSETCPYPTSSSSNAISVYQTSTQKASSKNPFGSVYRLGPSGNSTDYSDIQQSLFTKGPLPTGFAVYADFMDGGWDQTQGIYCHVNTSKSKDNSLYINTMGSNDNANQVAGGHAVVIVGWGVATIPNKRPDGTPLLKELNSSTWTIPYWWVRNSWGPDWSANGYFRIAMTNPSLNINTTVYLDSGKDTGGFSTVGGPYDFDVSAVASTPNLLLTSSVVGNSNYVWIVVVLVVLFLFLVLSRNRRMRYSR
jgi:hypothetical protein